MISAWWAWHSKGVLPRAGGWCDQPLSLLAAFNVLDLTYNALDYLRQDNAQLGNLSAAQQEVFKFLQNDDGE